MDVHVARQAIFDRRQSVIGYELLFRRSFDDPSARMDEEQTNAALLINSFLVIGSNKIAKGRKIFVDFTRKLLLGEILYSLPKSVVVQLTNPVEPDVDVMAACYKLKRAGYPLVVGGFALEPQYAPLLEVAEMVRMDFSQPQARDLRYLLRGIGSRRIQMLATEVDTKEEFDQLQALGYSYAQGYFFSKPNIISGRDIPGYKLNYLRLLQKVNQPNLTFEQLEEIVKLDLSLSYKLLKLINSAAFGLVHQVSSLKQALVFLGMREVQKWVSLVALSGLGSDRPEELLVGSMMRARFCELLAPRVGLPNQSSDLFLLGLFSMIEGFIDRPLPEILDELLLSTAIKDALLNRKGRMGEVYKLVAAYERGRWEEVSREAAHLGVEEQLIPDLYLEAMDWANEVYQQ